MVFDQTDIIRTFPTFLIDASLLHGLHIISFKNQVGIYQIAIANREKGATSTGFWGLPYNCPGSDHFDWMELFLIFPAI